MQYFYKAPKPKKVSSTAARPMGWTAPMPAVAVPSEAEVASLARTAAASVVATSEILRTVLIEATQSQKEEIEKNAGIKLYPNNPYHVASTYGTLMAAAAANKAASAGAHPYKFTVQGTDGKPLAGATVIVFLKGNDELKAEAETDGDGVATFHLRDQEAINVQAFPLENYWCATLDNAKSSDNNRILQVEPITFPPEDSLAHFRLDNPKARGTGKGIKVAVIDTGIDSHRDLPQLIVKKTIINGDISVGCDDNWLAHGTHVAGIIAGKKYGVAPDVQLMGYCVFPKEKSKPDALSLDIETAIGLAVQDGADIINLSLGWNYNSDDDEPVLDAIREARNAGVFVVAATGNDGLEKVLFPANLDCVCAVGALGVQNKFPVTSTHRYVKARNAANSDGEFVAHFSNFADDQIQIVAPGLGVISTTKLLGYRSMSGTSMAAPVISGLAARILSSDETLRNLQGSSRAAALEKVLYNECDNLGFDKKFVGVGVPAY